MAKSCETLNFPKMEESSHPAVGITPFNKMEFCRCVGPWYFGDFWKASFSFVLIGEDVPDFDIYVQSDIRNTQYKLTTRTPWESWVNTKDIVKPGDDFQESVSISGAGPWRLSHPVGRSAGSSGAMPSFNPDGFTGSLTLSVSPRVDIEEVGPIWTTDKEGNVRAHSSYSSVLNREKDVFYLDKEYVNAEGFLVANYTVGGEIHYMHGYTMFKASVFSAKDVAAGNWWFYAYSKSTGLHQNGSFQLSTPPQVVLPLDEVLESPQSLIVSTSPFTGIPDDYDPSPDLGYPDFPDDLGSGPDEQNEEDLRAIDLGGIGVSDYTKRTDDTVLVLRNGQFRVVNVNDLWGPIPAWSA